MEKVEVVVVYRERATLRVGWLIEHGFDPDSPVAEFDVLRARM